LDAKKASSKAAKSNRSYSPQGDREQIAADIVDSAIKIHSALGPGLLESAYQACLAHELTNRGYTVATEVLLPLEYAGLTIEKPIGLTCL